MPTGFPTSLIRAAVAVALAAACLHPTTANATPVISEFLAINKDSIRDSDGDRSDWIEIRNSSSQAIDLAGYSLSDDLAQPQKWTFPLQILPGGSYLIVFASGKDRRVAGQELHTNFGLDASGEALAIYAPGSTTPLQSFDPFPPQLDDISYGEDATSNTSTAITTGAPCRWLIPNGTISNWNTRTFNDSTWTVASTGVGYERSSNNRYDPLIGGGGDTEFQMYNRRTSAYIRIPFQINDPAAVSAIRLRMKFDDGFAAFINGQPIASSRAPSPLNWNSLSTLHHDDDDAVIFENFDVTEIPDNLVAGENILAIQGLNRDLTSSDFIILPELDVTSTSTASDSPPGFHPVTTPGTANTEAFEGIVADTKFSVGRGFYSAPISVEITTATPGAQIRYTTDGSQPTSSRGLVYTTPVSVATTTTLRAAAFRENYFPTNVDTQTYLFTNTIRSQPEMDTDITNNASYTGLIDTALRSVPTMSIVVDNADFLGPSGIYTNWGDSGRAAEVPISLEYFNADASEQFQIDAGIRIHGGNARSHPKKPLRLYFRSDYGATKLRFPLFEGSPVDSFDQLLLRSGGHDSWSLARTFGRFDNDLPPHGTIMRDQFLRRSEIEMGILSPRGKYVQVYINGIYWGLYDLHERANEDFFADHGGGEPEDYDVLHHPQDGGSNTLVSGNSNAWDTMMSLASRTNTQAEYEQLQQYLDIDSYIIAMFTRMWSGDFDWCGPISLNGIDQTRFFNKNWYAGRQSRNSGGEGRFKFFCWDAEMSMGLSLDDSQRILNYDLTGANYFGSPVDLYDSLRSYPEFQVRFGDLLQKHLFDEGAMSKANNLARLSDMETQIEDAIIAESARWGDEGGSSNVFDRDDEWRSEVNWLKNTFIDQRNDILIGQFRSRGLYPTTATPIFSVRSSSVPVGTTITLSGGGTIYYTLDGSDPRLVGGNINPSAILYTGPIPLTGSTASIRTRRRSGTNWSALDEASYVIGNAASTANLTITEIHYHPTGPGTPAEMAVSASARDFEFLELTNTTDTTVNLAGIHFVCGIKFTVDDTSAAFQQLPPGSRAILVSNRGAFLTRYGTSLSPLIIGIFADDTNLNNGGETLTLLDAFGETISSIDYSDSAPWPTGADGFGPSLTLRDPVAIIDATAPASWRISYSHGGTPGAEAIDSYASWAAINFDPTAPDFDQVSAPTADPDFDGLSNLAEYALLRHPRRPEQIPASTGFVQALGPSDYAAISYDLALGIPGVSVEIESSSDLASWRVDSTVTAGLPLPQEDGTTRITRRTSDPLDGSEPAFLRLRITLE